MRRTEVIDLASALEDRQENVAGRSLGKGLELALLHQHYGVLLHQYRSLFRRLLQSLL